jgi:hypothetical protein
VLLVHQVVVLSVRADEADEDNHARVVNDGDDTVSLSRRHFIIWTD